MSFPRIINNTRWLPLVAALALPLSGCGQKGPLYLPDDQHSNHGQAHHDSTRRPS